MPINESARNDLRMLFQTKVDDSGFFKQQQWRVTNYAVLSYAALIAVAGIAKNVCHTLESCEKWIAVALIIAVALAASFTIRSLGRSLNATRDCVDAIIPHLSSTFRDCYNVKWAQIEKQNRDWPFPLLFYLFIAFGLIVSGWILITWF